MEKAQPYSKQTLWRVSELKGIDLRVLDTLTTHLKKWRLVINIQVDKEPEHIRLVASTPALLGN